eukprot:6349587-Lingulodinium_polyedra.AAC.1
MPAGFGNIVRALCHGACVPKLNSIPASSGFRWWHWRGSRGRWSSGYRCSFFLLLRSLRAP